MAKSTNHRLRIMRVFRRHRRPPADVDASKIETLSNGPDECAAQFEGQRLRCRTDLPAALCTQPKRVPGARRSPPSQAARAPVGAGRVTDIGERPLAEFRRLRQTPAQWVSS